MPVHDGSRSDQMRGLVHPDQNVLNATQNSLCRAVNRVRGRCVCKASSCRRGAKFSRTRSSRERKELTIHPKRCRSDTIMARILSELSEFSFALSDSFCRRTTFWRDTGWRLVGADFCDFPHGIAAQREKARDAAQTMTLAAEQRIAPGVCLSSISTASPTPLPEHRVHAL